MEPHPSAEGGGRGPGALRTSASHTIGVAHLARLLESVPTGTAYEGYARAVLEENVLDRPTYTGRRRVLRHLRELYMLDDSAPEFHALRELWADDEGARPLLAGLLAFNRDELFRASWPAIAVADMGQVVTSDELARAVGTSAGGKLGAASLAKVGRNVASSWKQTGHLMGRSEKQRVVVEPRPAAVAYATVLGYLSGARGALLLQTPWFDMLDLAPDERAQALDSAHRRGVLDVRSAGSVLDVDVSRLLDSGGPR